MNPSDYKHSFEPITIGTMRLRNRIIMAPMHTKFADEVGGVTERLISYHVERAKGGVGLIVVENTCIDWEVGRAAGNPVTIHDDLFRTGLSDLAEAVHLHGAKIIPELHHAGRQNARSNTVGHKAPIAPSAVRSTVGGDEPQVMTEEDIEHTIQQFVDAARRTKECGYDGVELHGCHGYLLNEFLSPHTNRRDDRWGGSLENRARFAVEIVRRTQAVVGADFPILYRISAEERIPGGLQLEEAIKFVKILENEGVAAIDVSAGIYESMPWIFTMQGTPPGSLVPLASAVKESVKIPVSAVSSLGFDPALANETIAKGDADLVTIGRAFLADAYWAEKVRENRVEDIRPCIRCSECIGFLFRGWRVHCVVNAETGFEFRKPFALPTKPRRIVVVGAGLAGLEYALTAARRGHTVTLLESSGQVGGQLHKDKAPAYKNRELTALLNFYETALRKSTVDLRVNTTGGAQTITEYNPELVVLAVGSKPRRKEITGGRSSILAHDVLVKGPGNLGQRVCVAGGDITGVDAAMHLHDHGRQVTLVENGYTVGSDVNPILQWQLNNLLAEREIGIVKGHVIKAENGQIAVKTNEETVRIAADSIVVSAGYEPEETGELEQQLNLQGIEVEKVGACVKPGLIYDAVHPAFWAAAEA